MPVSRLKSGAKTHQKRGKRHDTSTPVKVNSRSSSSSGATKSRNEKNRKKQYDIGTGSNRSTRYCTFTAKQTRAWKPLDKEMRQHLYIVIDNVVKMVGSKPVFVAEDDVQEALAQLKLKLKAKLHNIKVPSKRKGSSSDMKSKMIELQNECERLVLQNSELEREIRQEERMIEALEDADAVSTPTKADLTIQVPENQLDLPNMVVNT